MGIFLKNISDMRERGELCDVIVIVENEKFCVHKLVLAAASEFFHVMLTSEFQEKDKSEIELLGQTAQSFRSFLRYIYSGEVDLTNENIGGVFAIAFYLQAQELIEHCEKCMIVSMDKDHCFSYLAAVEQFQCSPVFKKALSFITKNFWELSNIPMFYEVKASLYKEILRQEEIADVPEDYILNATLRWIERSKPDDDTTAEMLQEIRWGLLKLSHLEGILHNRLFLENKAGREMVERAIRYLKDERMQPILGGDFSTPRGLPILAAIGGDVGYQLNEAVALGSDGHTDTFWTEENVFESLPIRMHFRECNACVVINNILFLVGGFQYDCSMIVSSHIIVSAHLLKYTPLLNRWTALTPLSAPRCGHAAVAVNYTGIPRIMVIGGSSTYLGEFSPTTVVYDIESDSWSEQDSFPHQVFAPAACVYEGHVYVSGGRDKSRLWDFMYRFSPETRCWEEVSSMLRPRSGHSMCAVNDNIYIVGVHVWPRVGDLPEDMDKTSCWTEMYNPELDQHSKIKWICPFPAEGNIVAHEDCIYRVDGEHSALVLNTTSKEVKRGVVFNYSKSATADIGYEPSAMSSALAVLHVPKSNYRD